MKKKKKDSELAQHLMDSLLDDVGGDEASYEGPPSASVSISGLVPMVPHDNTKHKARVEKARGFISSEAPIGTDEEDATKASKKPKEPTHYEGTLWSAVRKHVSGESPQNEGKLAKANNEETQLAGAPEPKKSKDPKPSPKPLRSIDENTLEIAAPKEAATDADEAEKTVVAPSAKPKQKKEPTTKVKFGGARATGVPHPEAKSYANPDASLIQAENLRVAQERILELESEVERLRSENEELASAGETIKDRADALFTQIEVLERAKRSIKDDLENELVIMRGRVTHKEAELNKLRMKNSELEIRLQRDLKKVRVRERELENRLELARMENAALARSKDETILDLKRRVDQLDSEAEAYRHKCQELNHQIDANQDQFRRTVKALRLALTNLEVDEEGLAPLKKAE